MSINPASSSGVNLSAAEANAVKTAAQGAQKAVAAETTSADKAAKDAFQKESSTVQQQLGSQRAGAARKRKGQSNLRKSSDSADSINKALDSASQGAESQGTGSVQGSEITPEQTAQVLQNYQDNLGSQIAEGWLSHQNVNIPHEKIADALSQARASGSSTPVQDAANSLNIDPALLQGALGTASILANTSLNPAVQKVAQQLNMPPLQLADAYMGAVQGQSQGAASDPNLTNLHNALAGQLNMTPEQLSSQVDPAALKNASQAALKIVPDVQAQNVQSGSSAASGGSGGSSPPGGGSATSSSSPNPGNDPVEALKQQGAQQQQMLAVAQQAQQNQQMMMQTIVQMAQNERQSMAQIIATIATTSQAIYKMMNQLFSTMFSTTMSVGNAWMSALAPNANQAW
jgi:hypothetical protein